MMSSSALAWLVNAAWAAPTWDALGGRALDASMRLIDAYPAYFDDDPLSFLSQTGARGRAEAWMLDFLLASTWISRQKLRIRTAGSVRHQVLAALAIARRVFVTQRALHAHLLDSFHDVAFWLSTTGRILRGFTNCEGQNHLAALLLRDSVDRVQIFETSQTSGKSAHTLLRIRVGGRDAFADAWGDVPLYRMDAGQPGPWEDLCTVSELRARGLDERRGICMEEAYSRGMAWPLSCPLSGDITAPPAQPAQGKASRPNAATMRLYLEARAHHVFGSPEVASSRYQAALATRDHSWVAHVAKIHLARLQDAGKSERPANS